MNNLLVALAYVGGVLVSMGATFCLLRFLFQAFKIDFYNPYAQAIVRVTNPLLKPLRRLIPGWGGYDLASLLAVLLLMMLKWHLILVMNGAPMLVLNLWLVWAACLESLLLLSDIFFYGLIIHIALSWLNPVALHGPVGRLLEQLLAPIQRPIQRLLPPVAGLDFSPVVILIGLQFLEHLISGQLR